MDTRFKWHMFITSFIPLWVTIILADGWDILGYIVQRWHYVKAPGIDIWGAVFRFLKSNALLVATIVIISMLLVTSIGGLNRFLKQKTVEKNLPEGRLCKVSRANKLSAEFLLAYILPMIAFDFSEGKGVMLFVIYFLVLAYLCIRNNNIYTNIYLELKRYRMYECDVECKVANGSHVYQNSLVISKRNLITKVDSDIKYWDFDNYIYIDLE